VLSIGRKQDGHYARVGQLVLWWYGFADSEVCAVWWLDAKYRHAPSGLMLKPPWRAPLYSEIHGKRGLYLRLFGWRLLSIKHDR
jgi:hypothetical protein